MAIGAEKIAENLESVRSRIADAAAKRRVDAGPVRLVAVTKYADLEDVQSLIEAGQTDLAESRVQNLTERVGEIDQWLSHRRGDGAPEVRWHMVGHLQRNKVKHFLEAADMLQSLDSLRLAEELSDRAAKAGRVIDCLLQVNCSDEAQKYGVAVGAAVHLAEQIVTLRGIRLTGLMTMAPLVEDPEQARFAFVRLRELFEEMRHDKIGGRDFVHLSMGMSNDFEVAVEEGATMVRIGSALFSE